MDFIYLSAYISVSPALLGSVQNLNFGTPLEVIGWSMVSQTAFALDDDLFLYGSTVSTYIMFIGRILMKWIKPTSQSVLNQAEIV